jgi:protein required for attachment to host cells
MPEIKIDRGEWVVVCDGAKALILENIGTKVNPNLKTKEVHEQSDLPTREIGTDAPGRAFQSVGSKRSAMEQTDWHVQEEERFLRRLASRLDAAVIAGQTKSLILVAPPRALGVMRQIYSNHVRNALQAEVDKDLIKLPVNEIAKHLTAM